MNPSAQRLLHPNFERRAGNASPDGRARGTANGRAVTIRASYARLTHGARQARACRICAGGAGRVSSAAPARTQEWPEDVIRLVSDWVEIDADGLFTIVLTGRSAQPASIRAN